MTSQLGSHPELDQSLFPTDEVVELSESLQQLIANQLWGYSFLVSNESQFQPRQYEPYFKYFISECCSWKVGGMPIAIITYRDFLDLVHHLRFNSKQSRDSEELRSFFPPVNPQGVEELRGASARHHPYEPLSTRFASCTEESALNAIYITVRLWLMINIGVTNQVVFTGRSNTTWAPTESLEDEIERVFTSYPKEEETTVQRIPKMLNAFNLYSIGGFEIIWTSNLADHLLLDEDMETITLYHHACVLNRHKNVLETNSNYILPKELLDETLRTLAVILPIANKKCQKWFRKEQKTQLNPYLAIDSEAAGQKYKPHDRLIDNYKYWNDRIIAIVDAFENSEPKGVRHWWFDRRKRVQWYTFWIAAILLILTVVFGLIQSITGVLQVYIAAHSVKSCKN